MEGLRPINNITKTASISSLETIQLPLNKKTQSAVNAPKALLEGYAKAAKEKLLPFEKNVSKTPVKDTKVSRFVSFIF